jgi:hypothetical protein
MRLKELIKTLARRWYIVLAGLALTAGACAVVFEKIPATYEATGSLVLMPPSATVGENGNPYLYLVGMSQALDVLTRRANASEVRNPILERFPGVTYSVDADRSTSGAVVLVKAAGPSPSATMDGLKAAMETVPATLSAMQDELSVKDYLRINLRTIVVDHEPTMENKTQLQLIIVAAGAGLVGTLLLARMLDGLLASRRDERDSLAAGHSTGTPASSARGRQRRSSVQKTSKSPPEPPDPLAEGPVEQSEKAEVRATVP